MSSNKIVKAVSFNVTKSEDAKMLKHIKRRNFSGYVKGLIMEDIKNKEDSKIQKEQKEMPPIKEPEKEVQEEPRVKTTSEKLNSVKKKLNGGSQKSTTPPQVFINHPKR